MTTIDELDRQIAELEETLHLPLRESALQLVRKQLAELQQERARLTGGVQNTVNNSGTIHGSVTGANYGTVQNFFGGTQPTPTRPPTREEEIAEQQERLARHRGTLSALLRRLAIVGSAFAPPEVIFGIREARSGIARARVALEGYGVSTEAHPDDVER